MQLKTLMLMAASLSFSACAPREESKETASRTVSAEQAPNLPAVSLIKEQNVLGAYVAEYTPVSNPAVTCVIATAAKGALDGGAAVATDCFEKTSNAMRAKDIAIISNSAFGSARTVEFAPASDATKSCVLSRIEKGAADGGIGLSLACFDKPSTPQP